LTAVFVFGLVIFNLGNTLIYLALRFRTEMGNRLKRKDYEAAVIDKPRETPV
jgi:hypothetical protein